MWLETSFRILAASVVLLASPFIAVAQSERNVERFDGDLAIGKTYTAAFIFVEKTGWRLSEPVKILPHHAVRIEWIDKKGILPSLIKENRYRVEFKVVAKTIRRAGLTNRWNTTYKCALREALILIPPQEPDS
ncbi:MAG TPA: hypothetical protein VF766_00445 [Pyrinomonadaceae bacterium]